MLDAKKKSPAMTPKKSKATFDPVYDPKKIESALHKKWEKEKPFKAFSSTKTKKKPFYSLCMFPYPSGAGLHVGHPRSYLASDIISRKKRMEGFNVLNPMGYDAFGLPAEQFAIQNKVHPRKAVKMNIQTFEKQLKGLGFSFDWDRRINTTDAEYYKWTQWVFLKLYNSYFNTKKNKAEPIESLIRQFEKGGNMKVSAYCEQEELFSRKDWLEMTPLQRQETLMKYRLAYEGEAEVNWCEELGTVLANDEVIDGKDGPVSERGGYPVTKKNIRQWFLRITAYADRLLSGLNIIDWPNHIKEIQRNWIGKSQGSEICFNRISDDTTGLPEKFKVFTTRAETLFGVTFLAVSAELASEWVKKGWNPSEEIKSLISMTIKDHQKATFSDVKTYEGIFADISVLHPVTQEKVPVWIANYVLPGYGTGAVMGVPAHDERDFEFAKKYQLKITCVVKPQIVGIGNSTEEAYQDQKTRTAQILAGQRCYVNNYEGATVINSGKFTGLTISDAAEKITKAVGGAFVTNYKMRDAIFARQRYWGEPIPLYKDKQGIIHEVKKLPLTLPNTTSYEPTGTGEGPLANIAVWKRGRYETNTMPGWAGSSWYHLRYMDANNKNNLAGDKELKYWKAVDMYLGGAEHSTGHLLYSRFWHKFLKDCGIVATDEPFKKLVTHGFILASDGRKMSKRWGNVVNPDDVIEIYGADTERLYTAFMGPYGEAIPWSDESMVGCRRFIERLYKKTLSVVTQNDSKSNPDAQKAIHKLVDKVTKDIEIFSFNTAVAKAMETMNTIDTLAVSKRDLSLMIQVLNPFIPHVTEFLWFKLENKVDINTSPWPKANKNLLVENEVVIGVQINGKLRSTIKIKVGLSEEEVKKAAFADENIQKYTDGKEVVKTIYVPNRIVNIVLKP